MTDKRFDELNEIFSNMSNEDYEATKIVADRYYQYGKVIELASILAKKYNITVDELLSWW